MINFKSMSLDLKVRRDNLALPQNTTEFSSSFKSTVIHPGADYQTLPCSDSREYCPSCLVSLLRKSHLYLIVMSA